MEKTARRAREHPAVLLTAGAMALSGGLLLHWYSRITFWRDEWGFLLHRRGWSVGTFLDPAVEHLAAIPILIYKLLLGITGMDSPRAYQVVAVLFFLPAWRCSSSTRESGRGMAGARGRHPNPLPRPTWSDLLFPYQIGFFGSMACGLAALLCLDRRTRAGTSQRRCCCARGCSSRMRASRSWRESRWRWRSAASASSGPTSSRCRRCSGSSGTSAGATPLTPSSRCTTPRIFRPTCGRTVDQPVELAGPGQSGGRDRGQAHSSGVVLCWCSPSWRSRFAVPVGRPSDRALGALAVWVGFWSLTALDASIFGPPTASRYMYMGVLLMVLFAAEVVKGARIGPGPPPPWWRSPRGRCGELHVAARRSRDLATIAQRARRPGRPRARARPGRSGPGAEPAELGRRLPRGIRGHRVVSLGGGRLRVPRLHAGTELAGRTGGGPGSRGQGLRRGAADPPGAGDDRGRPTLPEGQHLLRAHPHRCPPGAS